MSELNPESPNTILVGTAGHIDHGKTTLIHALTGMDTDRLAEEKRRGISIDLGFAHLSFPDGSQISFIDVPGHERFIKNMLAGVGGIAAVLLVVAANEGVKPQTREHFAICRLLQISTGLIAITKIDIATDAQVASTRTEVQALVNGTFLEQAAILPVSASSGEGLPALRTALQRLIPQQTHRSVEGFARLPIDRAFAAKGFGTVVTGTLLDGQLRPGDTMHLHPVGKTARIRSLQVHGRSVDLARAGERTAVNLNGIEHSEIERGFVLTHVNELTPTSLLDASVDWLDGVEIPVRRESFLMHAGAAEIPVDLKVINSRTPGPQTPHSRVRIWLDQPALVLPGDRFVLRRPSPAATVAGGEVLDAEPPKRLNRMKLDARLVKLESGTWSHRLELLISESQNGRRLTDLVRRTGLPADQLLRHITASGKLLFIENAQRVFSQGWMDAARQKLVDWLQDFHTRNPSAPGAPMAQARMNLEAPVAAAVFENFAAIRIVSDTIALASHRVQTMPEQTKFLAEIEHAFRQAGFQPPAPAAVLQQAGTDLIKGRAVLEALIKAQRLVRLSDEIIYHADVLAHIRHSLAAHKGRTFSIPEFKEWTQISRKYAVPLLEYLDRQHVTKRQGDNRIIL